MCSHSPQSRPPPPAAGLFLSDSPAPDAAGQAAEPSDPPRDLPTSLPASSQTRWAPQSQQDRPRASLDTQGLRALAQLPLPARSCPSGAPQTHSHGHSHARDTFLPLPVTLLPSLPTANNFFSNCRLQSRSRSDVSSMELSPFLSSENHSLHFNY